MSKKNFTVFLQALLLVLINLNSASATPRIAKIIGGRTAGSNAWSWMAGLVYKHYSISDGLFCGASLIAKDWVLTAAHCVIYEDKSSLDIIINQAELDNRNAERLAIEQIIIHPLFDNFSLENDLALIKLATPSHIQPIQVLAPFSSQDNAGKPAIALGWGSISPTSRQYSLDLHQVELPIIDTPRCDAAMGDITDGMLCAGEGLGLKDTCFGDSGGPLVVFDSESRTWHQAGITSWGFGCAIVDFYGVYTRLKTYASFISDHICSSHELPPPVSLKLNINGNIVSTSWNALNNISGYRLNYAPYPAAQTIGSIDMNHTTDLSVRLETGSAYYVAISSYNNNCLSAYSNIEHFIIK
ncbi:MAG: trypsin-like serine protease [Methyloprofundus sp.]|nr:trypsin-like serine protease [Methyloprofundus sp.]